MRDPLQAGEDSGFTLVELLVVMVVIGVLAAIAAPVLLSQRAKAADTVTRHDASVLARAVAAWWTGSSTPPTVALVGGHWTVGGDDLGAAASGVVVAGADPTTVDTTGWTPTGWCLTLTNPAGSARDISYSYDGGLHAGACSSPSGS